MRNIFGWSYPPGCSGPPEDDGWYEDDPTCVVCNVSVPVHNLTCGPSCDMADEEGMADADWFEHITHPLISITEE